MIGALVFLGAIASPAAAAKKPKAPPRPKASIILHHPGTHAPVELQVQVLVSDLGHELSCPSFVIDCGARGQISGVLSDCDPYALPEDRPTRYLSYARTCVYYRPDTYTVRGFVTDQVHGPGKALPALMAYLPVLVGEAPAPPPAQVASR